MESVVELAFPSVNQPPPDFRREAVHGQHHYCRGTEERNDFRVVEEVHGDEDLSLMGVLDLKSLITASRRDSKEPSFKLPTRRTTNS